MKRAFDITLILLSAWLWLPMMAATGLLVLLVLGRPVFFRQERPGLRGKLFQLIKFRSMRAGGGGDEERLTKFGCFLRMLSLDELPELVNVLRGEMSLVGPRPLLMRYLPRYTARQMGRHDVRPGITGWAQVNGLRGDTSIEERTKYDLYYVENWSVMFDIKIMFMSVFAMKNAY